MRFSWSERVLCARRRPARSRRRPRSGCLAAPSYRASRPCRIHERHESTAAKREHAVGRGADNERILSVRPSGTRAALPTPVHVRLPLLLVVLVPAPAVVAGQSLPSPAPTTTQRRTLEAAIAEALDKNLDLIAKRRHHHRRRQPRDRRAQTQSGASVGGDHLDLLGTGFDDDQRRRPAGVQRSRRLPVRARR